MSSQPWINCTFCLRTNARRCWVYVIARDDEPWSKVGITFGVGSRMATYRKKHGIRPSVGHRIDCCCESMAMTVETAAHALLERHHQRQQGDWFDATAEASTAAVERAIRSDAVRAYL